MLPLRGAALLLHCGAIIQTARAVPQPERCYPGRLPLTQSSPQAFWSRVGGKYRIRADRSARRRPEAMGMEGDRGWYFREGAYKGKPLAKPCCELRAGFFILNTKKIFLFEIIRSQIEKAADRVQSTSNPRWVYFFLLAEGWVFAWTSLSLPMLISLYRWICSNFPRPMISWI